MMKAATQQAYREVLKLVRKLPPPTRSYYTQYARENFVTYSEAEDPAAIRSLLLRAHHHTCWVLKKVRVYLLNSLSLVNKEKRVVGGSVCGFCDVLRYRELLVTSKFISIPEEDSLASVAVVRM